MTDEELRQEARELLKQSNDVDYENALKEINKKANRELPLDTPIQYVTGRCWGFEGNGLILNGIIRIDDNVIIVRFDRPRRTQREGGEVHASLDIWSFGRTTLELEPKNGEFVIEDSTIGDKETFIKYINCILDYTDHRAYLIEDPRKLVKKNTEDKE